MSIEERLYVVVRDAVNGQFATYADLANKIHDSAPAEFTYNRLEQKHVMQAASIADYVSLTHFIGLLRVNASEMYEGVLDEEPTVDGVEELVRRKAVEKLEDAGFNRNSYERAVKRMLRQPTVVLPTLRNVYQAMALKMTEAQFAQLSTIGGVRRHFGFTIVSRRVMLPTSVTP